VADTPTSLGQGLWLARVCDEVTQSAVALVRAAAPFSHAEQDVQALLLVAARDGKVKPVLENLTGLLASAQQGKLCTSPFNEVSTLLLSAGGHISGGLEATFTIVNPHGLHARPGAMLVKTTKEFSCQITVANLDGDSKAVNAKSLMKLVSLGVKQGHRLHFSADGVDAELALKTIGDAIAAGLGEGAAE
jgi:Phosphotransferase System HPr (HPr) Family